MQTLKQLLREAGNFDPKKMDLVYKQLSLMDEKQLKELVKRLVMNVDSNTVMKQIDYVKRGWGSLAREPGRKLPSESRSAVHHGEHEDEDTYFGSAKGIKIDRKRVDQELALHSVLPGSKEYNDIWKELGQKPKYDAQEVLGLLGY